MLPIHLLVIFLGLSSKDSIVRCRQLIFERFNKFKQYGFAFRLNARNGKPDLKFLSYTELISVSEKSFNSRKSGSIKEFVTDAFGELRNYLFVVFETSEAGNKFVQYHTEKGTYLFDYPFTQSDFNKEHFNEVVELLESYGFVKIEDYRYSFRKLTYTIREIDSMTLINAECGNDKELAINLTCDVYQKLFKAKNLPHIIFG